LLKLALSALCLTLCVCAQPAPAPRQNALRFDLASIDRSADPCTDFYQFACGSWIKNNPIPPDQSRWGRFSELQERNRGVLHGILEEASKADPKRDAVSREIGDYYAACMDEKAVEARGIESIQPYLDRIRNLKEKGQLAALAAQLQKESLGALFDFGSGQDFKDSTQMIAQADQGGIGLPDRDYYFREDAKSVELRQKYVAHVARMFELMGETADAAKAHAAVVMRMETALAKGSLDNVSRRDPNKVYHKITKKELQALSPAFHWNEYFAGSGSPAFDVINVAWPDFFKAVNAELDSASLDDWKTYFTWRVVHASATYLPARFLQENFDFYGKTLTGAEQMRPRWKRCVDYTDAALGDALGQKFVEATFGKEGKTRTLAMVDRLEQALAADIKALPWMTPATKQKADVKLKAIKNKIGYTDHWRDYSSIAIKRDDFLGNNGRAGQFEFQRQLNKIGKPVDRGEWEMSPPTVNAYYDPLMNDINFPAGILQPPFYDNDMDDAVNYGGIGMVIGHELTHGFDDEGSQFDGEGNLKNWWTAEDHKEFDQREACLVNEYSNFSVAPGVNVNGQLTLGENTADNGGVRVALMALENALASRMRPEIGGFTPEQRFFLSFGQVWCSNDRPEAERLLVQTDPHTPPRFRVNGVVRNMPEFQKAFSCKAGQPMAPANACHVW
jgi:endothelin-converting enzyme/putative endopeptidase